MIMVWGSVVRIACFFAIQHIKHWIIINFEIHVYSQVPSLHGHETKGFTMMHCYNMSGFKDVM